jgi:hypothetical protein
MNARDRVRLKEAIRELEADAEAARPNMELVLTVRFDRNGHICSRQTHLTVSRFPLDARDTESAP